MKIDLSTASKILKEGRPVAVPTDTVYGVAVDYTQKRALHAVFELKGRAFNNPLVILAAEYADIAALIQETPKELEALMMRYWPGDLTLVLPVHQELVPPLLRADLPTTGFRVPAHRQCRELLRLTGPLAVTSANPSGVAPAQTAEEVERYWGTDFPILEGDPITQGVASTVLCWTPEGWTLGREGRITRAELKQLITIS